MISRRPQYRAFREQSNSGSLASALHFTDDNSVAVPISPPPAVHRGSVSVAPLALPALVPCIVPAIVSTPAGPHDWFAESVPDAVTITIFQFLTQVSNHSLIGDQFNGLSIYSNDITNSGVY